MTRCEAGMFTIAHHEAWIVLFSRDAMWMVMIAKGYGVTYSG